MWKRVGAAVSSPARPVTIERGRQLRRPYPFGASSILFASNSHASAACWSLPFHGGLDYFHLCLRLLPELHQGARPSHNSLTRLIDRCSARICIAVLFERGSTLS